MTILPLRARATSPVVLLFLGLVESGCIHTDFVQSSPSFVVHESAQRPVVYFDHLPEQPYTSVGVIDVIAPSASRLEDVFAAAADKGKEIGCDLVVDRSIHRVADAGLPPYHVIAHVTALDLPAPPPPRASGDEARALGYAPGPTPVFVAPAPAPAPVTYAPAYSPPPDRREFICGVWAQAPAAPLPATR
jgi:hypothetical protein